MSSLVSKFILLSVKHLYYILCYFFDWKTIYFKKDLVTWSLGVNQ